MQGRIIKLISNKWTVLSDGKNYECSCIGKFRYEKKSPVVGDVVIFDKEENPYKHLQSMSGVEDEGSSKTNVFEAKSIAYKQATILDGWDDL